MRKTLKQHLIEDLYYRKESMEFELTEIKSALDYVKEHGVDTARYKVLFFPSAYSKKSIEKRLEDSFSVEHLGTLRGAIEKAKREYKSKKGKNFSPEFNCVVDILLGETWQALPPECWEHLLSREPGVQ